MTTYNPNRRQLLQSAGAILGGAALLSAEARAQEVEGEGARTHSSHEPVPPHQPPTVTVPNGSKLAWRDVGGVKVFHLIAEEVEHEFAPGLKATCWGYNGSVHGPLIEAFDGDRVRIFVTNRLPAATTVHWHGLLLPNGMDGVGGLNQRSIKPGETFKYEFTLRQTGTCMYHAHHDEMTQIALGMTGLFVIHPRAPQGPTVDRDFAVLLHEWRIDPGSSRPNPNEMTEFNVLTMNAKVFPATAPLVVRKGDRVRIRFGNLGPMDHHPIHLHGYRFLVTETDGGPVPPAAQWPETTVLVPVGSTRTIEFVADEPGDWALHCHMTHHVMNQMGHGFPNTIGVRGKALNRAVQPLIPGYMSMGESGMADMGGMGMKVPENSIPMVGGRGKHDEITMGGMFTVLKVRDDSPEGEAADPGWYENPKGTLAVPATETELRESGIETVERSSKSHAPKASPKLYVCPMHPDVKRPRPGRCPRCGMTLEETAK